ncbi:CHASE2 domain-containing protein [[Limnothrix rosea] IAM M-220]|uniref:CHASE2 domain-containing protein n=1 Tax=[Limnothrix rosea] IAM M-220 TaxID=454133 RepID=UPI000963E038|nr:adenylate/guanylate cyclase domain-containing protein [[Limnothrix rosea] IAM M-220]OKH18469.1 adenylate/guanylate cyclase domain-containing protein [[Limnothrix rosea] IAM M-220]
MALNRHKVKRFWQNYQDNILLAIALILLTGVVLESRRRGGFEQLELQVYDRMLRQQPELASDDRLVLVEINEEDLRQQERWPFTDEVYAEVLENIQAAEPAVIGLDVYRDFPVEPGYSRLVEQFKKPNLIAIRNLDVLTGTPAPPAVVPEQQGFNDFTLDPDGVLRRALLYATGSDGMTLPSFALSIAMLYLYEAEGISPQASEIDPQYLQLGEATFFPLETDSGGYQTVDARGYQMLFHYRDRSLMLPTITFTDVWLNEFDPQLLKDKIVLIGSTAPSLKDLVISPFSLGSSEGSKMNGVVAHAQVLSYILDTAMGGRSQFRFWQEWQETVWVVVWLTSGAVIGWWLRHPIAIVGGLLFGIVGTGGIGYLFLQNFVWIPVAAPMVSFLVAMGFVIVYQSYQDFRQQKMVMTLLGQNTSPAIADALWEERSELLNSGHLPGRSLTATMLFLDVRGFSTISETMSPPALLDWLNDVLEMVTHEVQSRNGIINKFTGDGIVAIFGVPVPRETPEAIAQDAQACVSAALAIAEKLEPINQTFSEKNLPQVRLRVGIFTGEVVAGSLGGKDRMEYGVIGDSVNTASRLESCAKERQPVDCRILIAEATEQYLDQKFDLEPWGPIPLKGKVEVVQVFRVLTPAEKPVSTTVTTG